jgi:hypothetical protein
MRDCEKTRRLLKNDAVVLQRSPGILRTQLIESELHVRSLRLEP